MFKFSRRSEKNLDGVNPILVKVARRALNATQDKDGEVCFSSSATPEFGYAAWEGGDWCGNEFYTITADDYDTAIITRAQYEAALAAIKAVVGHNGWVQWAGGECPVDSDAIVEVRYRKTNPYQYNNDRAGDFYWAHTGSCGDIIAYRVHDKGINHRANDNRLDQDLNECIGQDVAPEWRGEGLPPVGVECEYSLNSGRTWFKCKIDYILGTQGLVMLADVFEGGQWVSFHEYDGKLKFRPLRTEAEKAREAACRAISHILDEDRNFQFNAKKIYDAIAAGKIPGVKLDK
jgi:hypothetical protein